MISLPLLLGTVGLLQQGVYQGATTPPSGDTIGYWQQRVGYTIVATLDEAQTKLHARGDPGVRQQLAGYAARDVRTPVPQCVSARVEMERVRRAREPSSVSRTLREPGLRV